MCRPDTINIVKVVIGAEKVVLVVVGSLAPHHQVGQDAKEVIKHVIKGSAVDALNPWVGLKLEHIQICQHSKDFLCYSKYQ